MYFDISILRLYIMQLSYKQNVSFNLNFYKLNEKNVILLLFLSIFIAVHLSAKDKYRITNTIPRRTIYINILSLWSLTSLFPRLLKISIIFHY